jgi:phage baseplate assembly protein W
MFKEEAFLGNGWSFPLKFNKLTNSIKMSSGKEDIIESLYILLSTTPGERIMQPAFGCKLKKLMFETLNQTIKTTIKNVINDAILRFESRISVNDIEFDNSEMNEGIVNIIIHFTIRTTNTRSNMVFPYYLNEGNNIP